jgi:PelA/Pel-15E family pectate lyase
MILFASRFLGAMTANELKNRPDAWFATDEGIQQIDNIISWQRPEGGWEKGYDATRPRPGAQAYYAPATQPSTVPFPVREGEEWHGENTIDNGITYTEVRVLSRAYKQTKRPNVLDSINRAIDFLLTMPYPNGGWPQRFPLADNYGRDITLNDNAMVNVMRLLKDIHDNKDGAFDFVDESRRAKAKQAFDQGVECLLKLQIKVNGKLTAWAQQYDPETLQPAKARAYELPGLSGDESAAAVLLLMDLDNPGAEVQRAVHAAAAWFEASQIKGIRTQRTADDMVVVEDAHAEPLWARYYEIDTNRPFFCGRDGIKKYFLAEIERERRRGYAWLRPWGAPVLKRYAKWAEKYPPVAQN